MLAVLNVLGVLGVLGVLKGVGCGKRGVARRACAHFCYERPRSGSVANLESRRVFWPLLTAVVDAGGTDVGMAQPGLDLGNVGFMF